MNSKIRRFLLRNAEAAVHDINKSKTSLEREYHYGKLDALHLTWDWLEDNDPLFFPDDPGRLSRIRQMIHSEKKRGD